MKIVFNSSQGECPEYNFNGQRVNIGGLGSKQMKQYEDAVALDMISRWGFLQEIAPSQVAEITKQTKEPEFKCDKCEFKTDFRVALAGHKRSHQNVVEEPQIDPNIVPVAGTKKILNADEVKEIQQKMENNEELPNGTDKDGVTWYGEGVKEENQSLKKVRPYGQGHFQ